MPDNLSSFRNFANHCLAPWIRENLNAVGCPQMTGEERGLHSTVARHEREINDLQEQVAPKR